MPFWGRILCRIQGTLWDRHGSQHPAMEADRQGAVTTSDSPPTWSAVTQHGSRGSSHCRSGQLPRAGLRRATHHAEDGSRLAGSRHQVLDKNLVFRGVHPPQLRQRHIHHLKLVAFSEQVGDNQKLQTAQGMGTGREDDEVWKPICRAGIYLEHSTTLCAMGAG